MRYQIFPLPHDSAPDAVLEVVHLKGIPLLLAAVAADGRDVEHTLAELDERPALERQLDVWGRAEGQLAVRARNLPNKPAAGQCC